MAFTIYSFGNYDFWTYTLGAVKNIIGSGDFLTLGAIALSLGIVWKILSLGSNPDGRQIISLISVPLILTGLLKGNVDVVIRDEILNQQTSIRNVPIIVAIPAYLVTKMEYGLAKLFDTYFSLPDGIKYLDFGYNIGDPSFKNSFAYTVTNAYYDRSWTNFMKDCVIPSISQGRINANVLINSPDIENELSNVNPAFTTQYCDLSGNCQTLYCDEAWNRLKADTQNLLPQIQNQYVSTVLTERNIYNTFTAQNFINDFYNISDYFLNYGVNLQNFVKQTLLIKEFNKGLANSAGYYGATDDLIARYMVEVSKPKINQTLLALGELAGSYVPLIKKILLILFIGATPIIFLLLYIDFLRTKALMSYFTVLISLTLWEPLFAILNLIIALANQHKFGVCANTTHQLSMVYFQCLVSKATTMEAIAGAAAWSVPTMALGLASGSVYAFIQGFGSIMGRISGGINASIATSEGTISTGKSYAALEESKRLGENYANIAKAETISYTQATASKLLALSANSDYFYEKGAVDVAKGMGFVDAYGKNLKTAYNQTKFDTQKGIAKYGAEKTLYGNAESAGKTGEAIKANLAMLAANSPEQFDNLVAGTNAYRVVDAAVNKLPFSESETASRLTRAMIGLKAEKILQALLGISDKNLMAKALKKIGADKALSALLAQGTLNAAAAHQLAANLKELEKFKLMNELKERGLVDEYGNLTAEGAQFLRQRLIEDMNRINEFLGKTHGEKVWEGLKDESKDLWNTVTKHKGEIAEAVGLAGYLMNKNPPSNPDNEKKPRRNKTRRPKVTPQAEEGGRSTRTKVQPPEGERTPRLEEPKTGGGGLRGLRGAAATAAAAAEEAAVADAALQAARAVGRTALRIGGPLSILIPNGNMAPAYMDTLTTDLPFEPITPIRKNEAGLIKVKEGDSEYLVPVIQDNYGRVWNLAALKDSGIGYNPETGNFFDKKTFKIVNPPPYAYLGTVNGNTLQVENDVISRDYDKWAKYLTKFEVSPGVKDKAELFFGENPSLEFQENADKAYNLYLQAVRSFKEKGYY